MARKRQLNPRAAGDYDKRLGELVRLRRKELGMSQSDLGAALGVSFQQIQKQERGVNRQLTAMALPLPRTRPWPCCCSLLVPLHLLSLRTSDAKVLLSESSVLPWTAGATTCPKA